MKQMWNFLVSPWVKKYSEPDCKHESWENDVILKRKSFGELKDILKALKNGFQCCCENERQILLAISEDFITYRVRRVNSIIIFKTVVLQSVRLMNWRVIFYKWAWNIRRKMDNLRKIFCSSTSISHIVTNNEVR